MADSVAMYTSEPFTANAAGVPVTRPFAVHVAAESPLTCTMPSDATPMTLPSSFQSRSTRRGLPAAGANVRPPSVLRTTPSFVVARMMFGSVGLTVKSTIATRPRVSQSRWFSLTMIWPF